MQKRSWPLNVEHSIQPKSHATLGLFRKEQQIYSQTVVGLDNTSTSTWQLEGLKAKAISKHRFTTERHLRNQKRATTLKFINHIEIQVDWAVIDSFGVTNKKHYEIKVTISKEG